jgi:hypothetical protein
MTELKHTMREKDFQQAIDEGLIIQTGKCPDTHRYHIKGAGIRWDEYHSRKDIETLVEAGHGGIATVMANFQQRRNYTERRYALLRHEYTQLKQLALDKKLITRNGKPCPNCKSTNTSQRSQRHTTYDGQFMEIWLDCYDCQESEYRGDRF